MYNHFTVRIDWEKCETHVKLAMNEKVVEREGEGDKRVPRPSEAAYTRSHIRRHGNTHGGEHLLIWPNQYVSVPPTSKTDAKGQGVSEFSGPWQSR